MTVYIILGLLAVWLGALTWAWHRLPPTVAVPGPPGPPGPAGPAQFIVQHPMELPPWETVRKPKRRRKR